MKNNYIAVRNMVRCKMDGYNNEEYSEKGIPKEITFNTETNEVGCRGFAKGESWEFHSCKRCKQIRKI